VRRARHSLALQPADMSGQAARAFGWPREWADQLEHAREQFLGITY
jgi:hypothetical protein